MDPILSRHLGPKWAQFLGLSDPTDRISGISPTSGQILDSILSSTLTQLYLNSEFGFGIQFFRRFLCRRWSFLFVRQLNRLLSLPNDTNVSLIVM